MGLRVNSRFEIKVSAIEKKNLYTNYIAKEPELYKTRAYCIAGAIALPDFGSIKQAAGHYYFCLQKNIINPGRIGCFAMYFFIIMFGTLTTLLTLIFKLAVSLPDERSF